MARLVAVCRGDEFKYSRRQLPLIVDGCSTVSLVSREFVIKTAFSLLVIEFNDACMHCNKFNIRVQFLFVLNLYATIYIHYIYTILYTHYFHDLSPLLH